LSLTNFAFTNALPKPLKNSIFHLKSLASDVEILNNSILHLTHSNFQFFVRFHRQLYIFHTLLKLRLCLV
jgi:hypothetical protein